MSLILYDPKIVYYANTVRHPVLEELPLDQWIELLYLHEQRHIEQIKEIKALTVNDSSITAGCRHHRQPASANGEVRQVLL
jgi:hypothetical protein